MVAVTGGALAPEVGEGIRDAQEKLRRAAQVANLHDDPLGPLIDAQIAMLSAQHRLFVDGTLKMASQVEQTVRHIEAARQPVRDDELRGAVIQGVSGHAARLTRALNWRNVLIGAGLLVVALVGGAGGRILVPGRGAHPDRCPRWRREV